MEITYRARQIFDNIYDAIKTSYGFVTKPHYSPAQNAISLHMPSWYYFYRPSDFAMHDLIIKETFVPKSLSSIIGLGLKFIPVPRTLKRQPIASFERFRKEFFTKVFFSIHPLLSEELFNLKLHV